MSSQSEVIKLIAGCLTLLLGLAVFVAGKIPALVSALKHGRYVWSTLLMISPLVPPIGMAYAVLHWAENRLAFWLMGIGFGIMIPGIYLVVQGFPIILDSFR